MSASSELWEQMLTSLETKTNAVNFDVWIKTLEPVTIQGGKLVLLAANEALKNFVNNKFKNSIFESMQKVNPLMTDVVFIDPSEKENYSGEDGDYVIEEEETLPKIENTLINPRYNFENFVVGSSNKFMFAAASAVAEEPGERYNPLFIYGGAGLGKTHIMHAIGNSIKESGHKKKVLYVSSEKFINEFIESIRTTKGKSTQFRDRYRGVDVLMIDDIQFIAGKAATQEEMFHTFNALYQENKQLIFSSDRPPKEIPEFEDRLRSRFEWGLIADVQPPDLETRIAILQKKAQLEKYNIPQAVLTFMAEKMDKNIRDMESLLNKVILLSRLYEVEPNIELAKEALKDYCVKNDDALTEDNIIDCVCRYFSVSKDDLMSRKKTREIVEPRQICIYLINEMMTLPLAAIGDKFGRDHTTIMHARDKVAGTINTNIKTKMAVSDLKDMILSR